MSGPAMRGQSLFARVFALDARSVAVFRIALGVTILIDLVSRATNLEAHYTDGGVASRALLFRVENWPSVWSFHFASGSTLGQSVLFTLNAVAAILLVIGWRPRVFAVVSWVFLISLQNRNPLLSYGFDLLLRVCVMWSIFLPLGARFSVDDLRRRRAGDRPPADAHVSAGALAFTLQMVFVYVFSGIQKLQNETWRDLSAVFYGVTTDHHGTALARVLAGQPAVCEVLTVLTLALELVLPLALFVPASSSRLRDRLRVGTSVAFALFHLGTASLFTIGWFPLVGIVAWIPFLPASVWERQKVDARAAPPRPGLDVDAHPGRAIAVGALVVAMFAFNIESVARSRVLRGDVRSLAWALRLDQTWNMFTRPMADGWFIAKATLADGRQVDVLRGGALMVESYDVEKPASVSATFPDMRWRKYITMLLRPAGRQHRAPFIHSLCRAWNERADEKTRAQRVELIFMNEREAPGEAPTLRRMSLGSRRCRPQGTRL